jgi:hypothetical protein
MVGHCLQEQRSEHHRQQQCRYQPRLAHSAARLLQLPHRQQPCYPGPDLELLHHVHLLVPLLLQLAPAIPANKLNSINAP